MKILVVLIIFITSCSTDTARAPAGRLIIYGDSISKGSVEVKPFGYYVSKALKTNLINLAVDGSSIGSANQYKTIMTAEWNAEDVIIYTPGVNDATGGTDKILYEQMLVEIIFKMKSYKNAFLGTPVRGLKDNSKINEYAEINRRIAANSGVKIIDFNKLYNPTTEKNTDWVHPNPSGQIELANIVLESMHLN
jgi:lysophospholipase L1-like esterase